MAVTVQDPFVEEICTYLGEQLDDFTFGSGNTNLKVGELVRNIDGVFAVTRPSPVPEVYTNVEYHLIDFVAVNKSTPDAFNHIHAIYNLLHRAYAYNTDNYLVHFSNS